MVIARHENQSPAPPGSKKGSRTLLTLGGAIVYRAIPRYDLKGIVGADRIGELICAAEEQSTTTVRAFSSHPSCGPGSRGGDAMGVHSGDPVRPDRKADGGMHPGGFALTQPVSG